ncbi:hypothetical protein BGZ46_006180 [Entomortierella lignicola]|nr:hypothetical protein BGZ46_006180 [Entomortierella lignicola]
MDERVNHANSHAIRAQTTRALPLISAVHHRALQLILATEANNALLTPVQRRNARTLQQHYHKQYVETCLHSNKSRNKHDNNIDSSVEASGSTSVVDRVRTRVDKTLERKRTMRGFVSAITPDKSNMPDYALCLADLAMLSCEPEMDLSPVPESLESLKSRSNIYNAEVQTMAKTVELAEMRGERASDQIDETSRDISIAANGSVSNHSNQRNSPPITDRLSPPNNNEESVINKRIVNGGQPESGTTRNQLTITPATKPIPSPQQPRQKYAAYEDDEEDGGSIDHAPVSDYKPTTYPSNKKRARNDILDGPEENSRQPVGFITAKEQMAIDEQKQEQKRANHYMNRSGFIPPTSNPYNNTYANNGGYGVSNSVSTVGSTSTSNSPSTLRPKMTGTKRLKFKPPINRANNAENNEDEKSGASKSAVKFDMNDERLKNIDPKMIEAIKNEIMESLPVVTWDDISGLEHAKQSIKETITWPMLRPEMFTGLRSPPKGLLLFGPPGTGKTMIGKCIASQSRATFFSISSSSLTSKWVGDGEKMVRALFAVARCHMPAVIFMDEIDSLLSQRSDGEVEASRRIKTEFLVQFDGVGAGGEEDRILIIGATNRPQEIDEAARRRFQKRLYIPLPENQGRHGMMTKLLKEQSHDLTEKQILDICDRAKGYSGSDITGLCREAAYGPIRAIQGNILEVGIETLRPINYADFIRALSQVRASVSDKDLEHYREWDMQYGSIAKG